MREVAAARTVPLGAVLLTVAFAGCLAPAPPGDLVEVVVLNLSDWHGQLDPVDGVGGAAALSAYFARERAEHPRTLTVTAGDAVGATPPLSGSFADDPAIAAMNLMGFDANTFGNHDFDAGVARARNHTEAASFRFLAANLDGVERELPRVAPWHVFDLQGVKVGVVGLVNEEAPTLTKPGSFGSLRLTDAAAAARKAREAMDAAGAEVFVVLTHKGVDGEGRGALVDLARNLTGYDLIVGDHTNQAFEARLNGALVVENPSKGVRYARVTLTLDRVQGRVLEARAEYVLPDAAAVAPDPRVEALLAPYRAQLAPVMDVVVAEAAEPVERRPGNGTARDSAMGNLVADALREATGVQVAFKNYGGTRSGLPSSYVPQDPALRREGAPYDIVRGDVFTALPFGNALVTGEVTGATLWAMVEHGLTLPVPPPDVSGVRVVFDSSRPEGSRVVALSLEGDALPCPLPSLPCGALPRGAPVLPDETTYTLTTLDFLVGGGDGFTMLEGLGAPGMLETEAVLEHLAGLGALEPRVDGRMWDLAAASATS